MTTVRPAIGLSFVCLALLFGCGVRPTAADDPKEGALAQLARQCESNLNDHGIGSAEISTNVVASDEDVEISGPCYFELTSEGSLTLNNVRLTSRNLLITDDGSPEVNEVRIQNSELVGTTESGFLIELFSAHDSIVIHHSTINYPLSVWMKLPNQGMSPPKQAKTEIVSSSLISEHKDSEGVVVTAGVGKFIDLTVRTSGDATVWVEKCFASNIDGTSIDCSATEADIDQG